MSDSNILEQPKAPLAVDSGDWLGGNSRTPKFGEWMRGIWASEKNPHRDGMYVRTVRRTGRMNPGKWYELTDGNGHFWQYEAKDTLYLPPNGLPEPSRHDGARKTE